jgi:hypothetical protein
MNKNKAWWILGIPFWCGCIVEAAVGQLYAVTTFCVLVVVCVIYIAYKAGAFKEDKPH